MAEARGTTWWSEELASLMENPLPESSTATSFQDVRKSASSSEEVEVGESLKEHAVGFLMAWCEILMELGRGCRDILQQNFFNEDSYLVQKLRGPCSKLSKRLSFFNDFLPEDRDPLLSWSIVFTVFLLAFAGFLIQLLLFIYLVLVVVLVYFTCSTVAINLNFNSMNLLC